MLSIQVIKYYFFRCQPGWKRKFLLQWIKCEKLDVRPSTLKRVRTFGEDHCFTITIVGSTKGAGLQSTSLGKFTCYISSV